MVASIRKGFRLLPHRGNVKAFYFVCRVRFLPDALPIFKCDAKSSCAFCQTIPDSGLGLFLSSEKNRGEDGAQRHPVLGPLVALAIFGIFSGFDFYVS